MLEKWGWLHKEDGKECDVDKNLETIPIKELLKKNQFIALVCVGVVILTICMQVKESKGTNNQETKVQSESQKKVEEKKLRGISYGDEKGEFDGDFQELTAYQKSLENQVETILTKMEGVGSVSVLITMKGSGEVTLEKNLNQKTKEDITKDSAGGEQSIREDSMEESLVLVKNNSGDENPIEVQKTLPQVEGVFIVCEGGGNQKIVSQITHAMEALFHIEPHKIVVVKGKPGKGVKQ